MTEPTIRKKILTFEGLPIKVDEKTGLPTIDYPVVPNEYTPAIRAAQKLIDDKKKLEEKAIEERIISAFHND